MTGNKTSNPQKAAVHLADAQRSLYAALQELRDYQGTQTLFTFAKNLTPMIQHFREGRLNAGIRVELLDRKGAASAMGKCRSERKLAALAKARAALAVKRELENISRANRRAL